MRGGQLHVLGTRRRLILTYKSFLSRGRGRWVCDPASPGRGFASSWFLLHLSPSFRRSEFPACVY